MMVNDHLLRLYIANSAPRFPIRPVSMQSVMLMNTIKHYYLPSINNLKVSQLTFLMMCSPSSWYSPDKLWLLLLWPIWCFSACISWLLPLYLRRCHKLLSWVLWSCWAVSDARDYEGFMLEEDTFCTIAIIIYSYIWFAFECWTSAHQPWLSATAN